MRMTPNLRFIPSRMEGLSSVNEVAVFADRIELSCEVGEVVTHRFADIARWPRPRALWRLLHRLGIGPKCPPVADRDWFHAPTEMFFEFYTEPRMRVFMPIEETKEPYGASHFARLQGVLAAGGFQTVDLG